MKILILSFLLAATNIQGQVFNGRIKLAWEYPPEKMNPDLLFEIYSTTNIAVPTPLWQNITNVVGTNTSVELVIEPGQRYFVMVASNFWGKSTYSNYTNTPSLPEKAKLGINKLP
jgi:hypothetical protein